MDEKKLRKILDEHMKWLRGEGGERANLRNANLRNANLRNANLRNANLSGANLCNANLSGADLSYAYLRDTYLRDADLSNANLSDADLSNANLSDADLSYANLSDADLSDADLSGANLRGADLCYVKNAMSAAFFPLQCPETGTYTAYKKAGGFIVRLEIPADARRSSATSRKCRADKAKVISITNLDGTDAGITEVASNHDANFIYTVGQTVTIDDFDTDRWKECAPGIHHFITIQEAVSYI